MVFHASIDVEGWICDCLYSYLDVTLFDIHHCLFDSFSHFKSMNDHWQSSSAKMSYTHLLALIKSLPGIDEAHFE